MEFTCPRGHHWPPAVTGDPQATCPECGEQPVVEPTHDTDPEGTLPPAETAPPVPGEPVVVPGYEIRGVLGRGGMGVVYRAWHVKLRRPVALKMIIGGGDDEERRRFCREAESVARLQHPNVVQIYEVGEAAGHPYLALELVDGGSLAGRLNGGPLPHRQAAAITLTLARAVQHAHEQGVVHRDLKPANVLLTPQGMPKITDFGLAKEVGADRGQTQSGAIVGTPSYMAPEQAMARRDVGPPADVYARGAVCYELLTGRPPFQADTALNTAYLVVSADVLPPTRLQPNLPRDLETICLKCLEKDARKRYASAEALAQDLRRFLSGQPILARPVSRVERARKWARRRPAAAALLGVSVLAIALLLAGSLGFNAALKRERDSAVLARERAEIGEADAEEQRAEADRLRRRAEEEEDRVKRSLRAAQQALYTGQLWRVDGIWRHSPLEARRLLLDRTVCPPEQQDFAWRLLHRASDWARPLGERRGSKSVAAAADRPLAVTADPRGVVEMWDLAAEPPKRLGAFPALPDAGALALTRDGKTAAVAVGKTIRLLDCEKYQVSRTLEGHQSDVRALAFTPDGRALASVAAWVDPKETNSDRRMKNGEVILWDAATGTKTELLKDPVGIISLAISANGKSLVVGNTNRASVTFFDLTTKKVAHGLGAGARLSTRRQVPRHWSGQPSRLPLGRRDAQVSA